MPQDAAPSRDDDNDSERFAALERRIDAAAAHAANTSRPAPKGAEGSALREQDYIYINTKEARAAPELAKSPALRANEDSLSASILSANSGSPRLSVPKNIKDNLERAARTGGKKERNDPLKRRTKKLDRENKWRDAYGEYCAAPEDGDIVLEPLAPRTPDQDAALQRRRDREPRRLSSSRRPSSGPDPRDAPDLRSGPVNADATNINGAPESIRSPTTIESITVVTDPNEVDFSLTSSSNAFSVSVAEDDSSADENGSPEARSRRLLIQRLQEEVESLKGDKDILTKNLEATRTNMVTINDEKLETEKQAGLYKNDIQRLTQRLENAEKDVETNRTRAERISEIYEQLLAGNLDRGEHGCQKEKCVADRAKLAELADTARDLEAAKLSTAQLRVELRDKIVKAGVLADRLEETGQKLAEAHKTTEELRNALQHEEARLEKASERLSESETLNNSIRKQFQDDFDILERESYQWQERAIAAEQKVEDLQYRQKNQHHENQEQEKVSESAGEESGLGDDDDEKSSTSSRRSRSRSTESKKRPDSSKIQEIQFNSIQEIFKILEIDTDIRQLSSISYYFPEFRQNSLKFSKKNSENSAKI